MSTEPHVIREDSNVWRVRLDGGLRVDTHHGLARAVSKIPFAERRRGGSYRLEGTFSQNGQRWARIRREDTTDA